MSDAVRRFYGSNARLYDLIASYTPGVSRWRSHAVEALDLQTGSTVIDFGCGTGASFPYLRDAVGPTGTVIGIDVTTPILSRARTRAGQWGNVTVLSGDATTPPVTGPVDGILGSFVIGLLDDPVHTLDTWRALLPADGRVALLDGVPIGWAPPLDWVFAQLCRFGAPPESRSAVLDRLSRRVEAGHGHLRIRGTNTQTTSFACGYIQVTAATFPAGNSTSSPSTP